MIWSTGWWWGGCALMMVVMMVMMIPMMGRGRRRRSGYSGHGWSDDPERTLAGRLARGEIDTEEYQRRLEALQRTDHPTHT